MSFTMEDNVESGWVAVRPNAFEEKEKNKFVFIVAWNEVEGKFAITCHNRTAQRRSFGRDSFIDITGQQEKTKWPKSPVKDKAARSPGKGAMGPAVKGIQTKSPPKSSPSKTPHAMKAVMSPLSPDSDVLEALQEGSPSPLVDHLDLEEVDTLNKEDCSWAGLFSFQDLRTVHGQLCSVNSDLEPCLPIFPEEPAAMWTVLFGASEVPQVEMDELCYRLHVYLGHALDTCGWKILSQVLFTENDDPEEYYESLSELRQSGYEEAVNRTKKHLNELLEQHRSMESMVELLAVYEEEDQAYGSLLEACTLLYQYLLQPFRDMRELAMLRRQQIKISMENDYLGPRRVEALKKEDSDWQKKAQEAVLNIQEFTVKYFEITAKAQKVAKETLQLQRAREICLEQRKHTLREEMQRLRSGEDALARLDRMEAQYYGLQLRLYDIQAEILQCEELLLTAQLDKRQDEVVYYDTFECPEAIGEVDTTHREELRRLQTSARQLEARRGRIGTKRSYLKNKREICVSSHSEKQRKRQASRKDSPRVSQERQTTLDRLRTFKQRYPGQVILKSTRLRAAHARRTERGGPRGEKDPLEEQATPGPSERRQAAGAPERCVSPLGPFVPRFFDSSQLMSARQSLRKTPELDAHSRRESSPMDEVLASLKRGCFHLRKVEQRALPPSQDDIDEANGILAQIRKGVALRRVPRQERREAGQLPAPTDPLTRSIHEALRRIKEASPDSESDEDDDGGFPCPDWES
ncbi:hypothetical protein NHX12_028823 [Muraenolepis orangiensis]|uniref:WH2 domain-containing protein n=1 Tax=Muraenolepis orangiensis TaxID=630683 RepID=A0A9Q0EGL1_9TELE|nr:hypothetical protein NHX12_028823 [Muraenolepis orangiensis]